MSDDFEKFQYKPGDESESQGTNDQPIPQNKRNSKTKAIRKKKKPDDANFINLKSNNYIEKIKDIIDINEQEKLNFDESLIDKKTQKIVCYENEQDKIEKCRQSARDTRKRKKLYIKLLEQKILIKIQELQQSRANETQPKQTTSQADLTKSVDINEQINTEYSNLFNKLEKALKSKETVDAIDLDCIIDSLRLRIDIGGKTRKRALETNFLDTVKLLMPLHIRYLIYTISQGSQEPFPGILRNALNDKQERIIKEKVYDFKNNYDNILHQLKDIQLQIHKNSENAQHIIDEMRAILPTRAIAQFLADLEHKRDELESRNIYPIIDWEQINNNDQINIKRSASQAELDPFQQQQQEMLMRVQNAPQQKQLNQNQILQQVKHEFQQLANGQIDQNPYNRQEIFKPQNFNDEDIMRKDSLDDFWVKDQFVNTNNDQNFNL